VIRVSGVRTTNDFPYGDRTAPHPIAHLSIFSASDDYRMNDPARRAVKLSHALAHKKGKGQSMRNLIYAINLTLDGCCDHTKVVGSDETLEFYTQLLREADLQVFGRKTYQLMVPYWPDVAKDPSETKASKEFARTFVSLNKVVFSRSLDRVDDEGNARIVRTNLQDEILKLKQEQGKSILVGGVDIPSQLIQLGLVDEYLFVVQPLIVGEGRRLLDRVSLQERLQLKLVDSKIFKSGCVALRYLKP
jgi:dihydrofolate reductase